MSLQIICLFKFYTQVPILTEFPCGQAAIGAGLAAGAVASAVNICDPQKFPHFTIHSAVEDAMNEAGGESDDVTKVEEAISQFCSVASAASRRRLVSYKTMAIQLAGAGQIVDPSNKATPGLVAHIHDLFNDLDSDGNASLGHDELEVTNHHAGWSGVKYCWC